PFLRPSRAPGSRSGLSPDPPAPTCSLVHLPLPGIRLYRWGTAEAWAMAERPGTDDDAAGASAGSATPERKRPPRTAILIVHGIGNQRPLATLRGLVRAVWTTDPAVSGPKPDHWLHFDRISSDIDLP